LLLKDLPAIQAEQVVPETVAQSVLQAPPTKKDKLVTEVLEQAVHPVFVPSLQAVHLAASLQASQAGEFQYLPEAQVVHPVVLAAAVQAIQLVIQVAQALLSITKEVVALTVQVKQTVAEVQV